MELDKLHVADPGPGPVGHGDAVPRGDVRVAGVEIDLAHPPGGQEGDGSRKGVHFPGLGVEDVGAHAGLLDIGHHRAPAQQALAGDQVNPHVIFKDLDIGVGQDLLRQDALHFGPGHVLGVNHPAVGMAPLPAQIIAVVLAQIEMGPQVDQLPDAGRTLAHHQFDDVRVGQAFSRGQGVLDVIFKPVIRPQHRGDAPLGLAGGGLRQALLGDQIDPGKLRHLQGITQPRQP